MEGGDRHGGDEDGEVEAEGSDEKDHEQHGLEVGTAPDVAKAFGEAASGADCPVGEVELVGAEKAERAEHGGEGEGVDEEDPSGAYDGDEDSGGGGADHAGGVE